MTFPIWARSVPPTIQLCARYCLGFAFVVGTQITRALVVLYVAEFAICTAQLRVGAPASVRLSSDDVAKATLAFLALMAVLVIATSVSLVRWQTRILSRFAFPIVAIVRGALFVLIVAV